MGKSLQKVNSNPTEIEKNSKKLSIGNSLLKNG